MRITEITTTMLHDPDRYVIQDATILSYGYPEFESR